MTQGNKYYPSFDRLSGVFRFIRLSDDAVSLCETGQDAIDMRDWCELATAEEVDERAKEEVYV